MWLLVACQVENDPGKFNTEPEARIDAPEDGASFDEGATVLFTGLVGDAQDDPQALAVTWTSDVDPSFLQTSTADGAGNVSLATAALIAGSHTIVLHAVDSSATEGTDFVTVHIADLEEAPAVSWVRPYSGEYGIEGEPFPFEVLSDDAQDAAEALAVTLTSDVDGPYCEAAPTADGRLVCDAVLSVATHVLTASVEDTAGNVTTATAKFQVVASADIDADGDGWTPRQGDCDDADAAIHPGAEEADNGVDDDCDGTADEGTWSWDDDGDCACEAPSCDGSVNEDCDVLDGYDCDDADDTTWRGAPELCDGVDNDCDTVVDEGTDCVDDDGDGWTERDGDCDDADPAVSPGAAERCDGVDNDCDTDVDEPDATDAVPWYSDVDADTYGDPAVATTACTSPAGYVANDDDCDDRDPAVNPAADERCNAYDDDCDGLTDESGAVDATVWYLDADLDSYGTTAGTVVACDAPAGFVGNADDCDDGAASVWPGAPEVCDGVDEDCDGSADNGVTTPWYRDADGDTYGDPAATVDACDAPAGYVGNDEDCDDTDATRNPRTVWYADADMDGFGVDGDTQVQCTTPFQHALVGGDCDDTRRAVNPDGTESCNGRDDDCDGTEDEANASGCDAWYYDGDGDGYGSTTSACLCDATGAYTASNDDDCYDANSNARPGTTTYYTSSRGDGDYDYDCDGRSSHRYSGGGTCSFEYDLSTLSFWCDYSVGWTSGDPGCGGTGTYLTSCELGVDEGIDGCIEYTSSLTQSCR